VNFEGSSPWASAEIFPGRDNVDISLILFQVANDAMQINLHEMIYPFYTAKKIPHESTRSTRIFLILYSGGVVFELAKRLLGYFLSSFTAFAELGYHSISLLL